MRDKDPVTHMHDLPPCSFSVHCQRFVDGLDDYHASSEEHWDQLLTSENQHEEQLIAQLREHVPACPTCKSALEQARRERAFQRKGLREVLTQGEQQVPSTTAQILQAIQHERQATRQQSADFARPQLSHEAPSLVPLGSQRSRQQLPEEKRSRKLFRTVCSLAAAAAIILASLGIFAHFVWLQPASSDHLAASPVLASSSRWSSVVMSSIHNGNQTISLYDPQTDKSVVLAALNSHSLSVSVTPAGISHNGTKLLYSVFDGKQTTYYLRSLTTTTPLFTVSGSKSRVVWSTDDRYIFVSTPQGIERIDVQSKAAEHILPALAFIILQYYRDGYLYYIGSQDGSTGILNRVDIVHGNVQAVTGACVNGSSFWQSPGGVPVYYVCEQPQNGLFVVNNDGTNLHLLRAQTGPMVGYAADGSPLILASTAEKYQVVKLGADEQQDRVVLDDVVPGGSIVSPADMAVAPFGYTLVARAVYDDYEAIWYGDLTNGQKHLSMKVEKGTLVGFYGWSRMLVP
jgi:hypothetical protein